MTTTDDIMLDEYGNPIGSLSVKMTVPTAVEVLDDDIETARDNALADNVAQLPGIEPSELAEFYPGYDDDMKRERAKRMLLIDGRSVSEIAAAIAVPERTVYMWTSNYQWAEARRRDIIAKDNISRMEMAETRIKERNKIFKEQLDQASRIRTQAMRKIDGGESMKPNTEAWAAAAKTEQTILGLSEAGSLAAADGAAEPDEKKPGTKQPLVVVVQGGGLPPIRRPQ